MSLSDADEPNLSPQAITARKQKSKYWIRFIPAVKTSLTVIERNDNLGRSYRNRVATFIQKMSQCPQQLDPYKSNPEARHGPSINESKMIAFATDRGRQAETSVNFNLGDSTMHIVPTSREVRFHHNFAYLNFVPDLHISAFNRQLAE